MLRSTCVRSELHSSTYSKFTRILMIIALFVCFDSFQAFSIFTGLGIHNCQMYENACRLMAKQTVALEVLSFHATAGTEETEKLLVGTNL